MLKLTSLKTTYAKPPGEDIVVLRAGRDYFVSSAFVGSYEDIQYNISERHNKGLMEVCTYDELLSTFGEKEIFLAFLKGKLRTPKWRE